MKLFRFIMSGLLALCLIMMPVMSSANAGSTTAPTPTKTLPTGFKFPPISEIAKRLASRANVVNYAVESLLGAVDWVLDPANNQIRYKPVSVAQDVSTSSVNPNDYVYPVHHTEFKVDIMYTTPVQACVHHIWNTYHNAHYVYTGYEFSHNGLLSCQFKNVIDGYESSIGWFPTLDREKDKEYTLPLDVVAEQIIKNAKAGHADSVEFILTMEAEKANEDTDTSNPDKEKDDSDKDKKKCLPATEANIRIVLAPTTELTTQERVSLPVIAIYVARIENGEHASRMKPIEVDGNIIVEGHHRFIAAKLCKQEPPRDKGTLAPYRKGMEYPLKNIEISPNDFGNR